MPMNYMKTAMLLAALTALFVALGGLVGGKSGMVIAFVIALARTRSAYGRPTRWCCACTARQEVDERKRAGYYRIVRDLAQRAGLPMPRVFVMDNAQPNAFATGRSPSHAAVCASTGLLAGAEPRGAHRRHRARACHVKNRDTLTMTVAATIGGAISMLAQYMQFGSLFGGSRDDRGGLGWIGGLDADIIAPLAAMLVQMAISRSREYQADRMRRRSLRPPAGARLRARQDRKFRAANTQRDRGERRRPRKCSSSTRLPAGFDNWFSTHPSTENRIAALEEMAREPGQMPETD